MKSARPETIRYIIEREYLAKITVTELVNHMIQTHMKEQFRKEVISS